MSNITWVTSATGLVKIVCTDAIRGRCNDSECSHAHPNKAGSKVSHPKWCLRGSAAICELITCPFNHFQTEAEFVVYRSADLRWSTAHVDLCRKYQKEINEAY